MNMDAVLKIKADVQGENNIRRLGNSMQGLQGQVKNAQLSFNSLKSSVAGFASAIAGTAIVGGLAAVVKQGIDAGDALNRMQIITGISAKALTGIGNQAKMADVDMGTLTKGLTKLNVNVVKAASGNAELAQKFKDLGVNIKDAKGNVQPTDAILKQLADRFADMPDGAQKAAAAVALFGKSGADLIPMLNDGAAAMDEFTYKISDDFAARSDVFNDTLTAMEIKTQGFGLELTDALLPALQSILEEFAKLFDSKNDWTSLFTVITGGLRGVATFLYATIKLMDQWVKYIVFSYDAIGKALKGDFVGAGRAISNGVTAGMKQAQQDFAAISRIWTDAPSPGTGLRTGGRNAEFTDLAGQKASDAAAKRAMRLQAQEAKKQQEDYNNAVRDSIKLAEDLTAKTRDIQLETQTLGAVGAAAIDGKYKAALNNIKDEQKNVFQQIQELVEGTGGRLKFEGLQDKAKGLLNAMSAKATADRNAARKQQTDEETRFMEQLKLGSGQLGTDEERRLRIKERIAQIERDMPDLYAKQGEEIRKLVTASEGLTEAQQRNKDILDGIAGSIGGALKSSFDLIINGTKDWAGSLREIAGNLLKSIADQLLQIMVIAPIVEAIRSIKFAKGGVFEGGAVTPFAKGGVVDKPTIFPFAKGIGLMGEAGPESIMPLKRGRDGKLGVIATGSGGGGTTINVSVDAKGSSVQGDSGKGNQLARVIAAAVQEEMVKQKRPGGLLAA
jgi:hypothetical protein